MSTPDQLKTLRQLQKMKTQIREREWVSSAQAEKQATDRAGATRGLLNEALAELDNLNDAGAFAFDDFQIAARRIGHLDQRAALHDAEQETAAAAEQEARRNFSTAQHRLDVIDEHKRESDRKAQRQKEESLHRSYISQLAAKEEDNIP